MKTTEKRMTRCALYAVWTLTATALTGCSEELSQMFSSQPKVEVVPSFVPMEGVSTRAADGLDVSSTGFSCVYAAAAGAAASPNSKAKIMIDDGASSYTAYTYRVTGSSALTVEGDAPTFPPAVNEVHVYGWYPYTASSSFTIQSNQSSTRDYCLSDLMLANSASCTRDGSSVTPAALAFRHVMSKVKLVLTPGTGVTITDVALKNVRPTVAIDASSVSALTLGAVSGSAGDVTLLSSGSITSASAAADKTLTGVFPAQTISSSFITVTAQIGGTPSTITYSFGEGSKTFVSGKEYTVNIAVNATLTGSPTVSLADWTSAAGTVNIGSGGGGGDAPTLSPSSLTLTYGGASGTITPTFAGATTFSGNSSNTGIATVSGTSTLTVVPVAAGSCTIQVFPTNASTGFSSAACNVTVNKAAQTVTLSGTNLTINSLSGTNTFTVTRLGDGMISAVSNNANAVVTNINQNTGVVTVRGDAAGSATITVTVAEGTNHLAYSGAAKTVTVNTVYMQINPLWWVAQYNMAQNKSSFVSSHSTSSQYVFSFSDAQGETIANYHQPNFSEQISIIPYDNSKDTGPGSNIFSWTETLASPREFVEKACNVGGEDVASTTSIWGKNADRDYYAIRFIGTIYCSAWHYKWVASPCHGLLIESYLLSDVSSLAEAKTKMATAGFTSGTFSGELGTGSPNLTPESSTATTNFFVQRFLPACGSKSGSSGTADNSPTALGYYWSSTADGGSKGFFWGFVNNGKLLEYSYIQSDGQSVRLFRDH